MEVEKLLFTLAVACIFQVSVMDTVPSVDGTMEGTNCTAGPTLLDCNPGGHVLLQEVTLDTGEQNQDQTSSLHNGSVDNCAITPKSLVSSCNGQEQCHIQSMDQLSNTCGDVSQLTLQYICLPGPVYDPCSSAQITMTRTTESVYVITPHYPYSYPRDPNSVQSSCTMEVLIPTGQTIQVTNYRTQLPTGTVLGVCGNSIHIALPKSVIDSTYCTEMEEIIEFTGDFQIRFYGTWMDKANGAILQIKDGALPTDQIASFTQCLRRDSQSTTTVATHLEYTIEELTTKGNSIVSSGTTVDVNGSRVDITEESSTTSVPNFTSKDFVSDSSSSVVVQNPSPTPTYIPVIDTASSITLATKTEENGLFDGLSTTHSFNIDSEANSSQSTQTETVDLPASSQYSTTDDINDDMSEMTTTEDNSENLSVDPITQAHDDTTMEPMTQRSEEELSSVSKPVFTTLNPETEEITNSSQTDPTVTWDSFDGTTMDPQSLDPETSTTTVVSRSNTGMESPHINSSYAQLSTESLVTESTTRDINYSTSEDEQSSRTIDRIGITVGFKTNADLSLEVTGQSYSTTEDLTSIAQSREFDGATSTSETTENNNGDFDSTFGVQSETTVDLSQSDQTDASSPENSAFTSTSSSLTSIDDDDFTEDTTTESNVSGISLISTDLTDTDGATTTIDEDDANATTEFTEDPTESQSIGTDLEDMESTSTTAGHPESSEVDTTQGTTSDPEAPDTSATVSVSTETTTTETTTTAATTTATTTITEGKVPRSTSSSETKLTEIATNGSPNENMTDTSETTTEVTRNTTVPMDWSNNDDYNITTTTETPSNSTGVVTVPNGSVIIDEGTSNVGIIIAGVLVGLVITFAVFNLCLVIIKLKRKHRRHCFFLKRDNNVNKKASTKPTVETISKLGPYDAYNADQSANITNIMPPSGEQDTAALIGLNIANGRVHSISIGGSNPRPANGNICHSSSDRTQTTSTFRPPEDENLEAITRTIPNIHYISSNELFQPPDFVPFSNSRTNLVTHDRFSDIDEASLYSDSSNDDSGYPKNSGSHVDQFLNSYPKSKDFYLSASGTLYPRSKSQSPCGTNEPPPNSKPSEKIEKFPISHSVALPITDESSGSTNNSVNAGGQSTQHKFPNHYKFNIAQNTTETRV